LSTLADLLNLVVTTLQASALCRTISVLETDQFSESQFAFKVRAELVTDDLLQVRLYRNGEHTDYSYQIVRGERPILRWDNKEHFRTTPTYPHHFHGPSGRVEASPLNGDPAHDLPVVLDYLSVQEQ